MHFMGKLGLEKVFNLDYNTGLWIHAEPSSSLSVSNQTAVTNYFCVHTYIDTENMQWLFKVLLLWSIFMV